METAFIGLGSNLGDGRRNLLAAWEHLGLEPGITLRQLSSPYRTRPVGMDSSNWFTNAVGAILTSLAPQVLLDILLAIEKKLGRDRSRDKGRPTDRLVDLDLLLYGDAIVDSRTLTLPHPAMVERLFVLEPLAEIAPDFVHPRQQLSISRLLEIFQQTHGGTGPVQDVAILGWDPVAARGAL